MNSTATTGRLGQLTDIRVLDNCRPKFSVLYTLFPVSEQPVILDDMLPDLNRLMVSVSKRFTDETCVHLTFEEMMGEARLKLAELIDRGQLERQPSRGHFFKFFKASIQNNARSRVQKYRFTEKRTGVKPPPREERLFSAKHGEDDSSAHDHVVVTPEHHKNVELSLDDEELGLQIPDGLADSSEMQHVIEDWKRLLTDVEKLVFDQLTEPNEQAYVYAQLDAHYKKAPDKIQIRVRYPHMAAGIGLTPELWEEAVLSIKQKIIAHRSMSEAESIQSTKYNAALASIKQLFGLQIPPGIDDIVIRRLVTIAARDQYSKVTPEVAELLEIVGAKVPKLHANDQLSCYGVLFQKTHRHCNHCGLRESCAVEAANVGLGHITLSPRLLGARQNRVPAILPVESDVPLETVSSPDEAELLSYLDNPETFTRTKRRNEIYYALKNSDRRNPLFCVEQGTSGQFRLRFCSPSEDIKHRLRNEKRSWYAPETATAHDVIDLIDQHAKETIEAHANTPAAQS